MRKASGGRIPYYVVDAFADRPFSGNPAAVCLDVDDLAEAQMVRVAAEMNLSETAFVHRRRSDGARRLRWFTPAVEVPLCGHATLASAHVLLRELGEGRRVRFDSASGPLEVAEAAHGLAMDLPANEPEETAVPAGLARALGIDSIPSGRCLASDTVALVALRSEEEVVAVRPDFSALRRVQIPGNPMGVAVTAPAAESGVDFASRFFAPWVGVDEDPVTGVAHATLAPHWARILGKRDMVARQRSARGGTLGVGMRGDRVELTGQAFTVAAGSMVRPE